MGFFVTARSLYQNSNTAPRCWRQTSIFRSVFFVFKSLLGTEGPKNETRFAIFFLKALSHVSILMAYWITNYESLTFFKVNRADCRRAECMSTAIRSNYFKFKATYFLEFQTWKNRSIGLVRIRDVWRKFSTR